MIKYSTVSDSEMACLELTIREELGLTATGRADLHAEIVALDAAGGLEKTAPTVSALKGQTRRGVLKCRRANLLGAVELWRAGQKQRAEVYE